MTEMDYSMVLFDGSDVLVSDAMPEPMLEALQRLICTVTIRYTQVELHAHYESGKFDYGTRMLHLSDGRVGLLSVGRAPSVSKRCFADFLLDTEGFWADREYRFPCFHAKTLQDTAEFIGHISVQEACNGD